MNHEKKTGKKAIFKEPGVVKKKLKIIRRKIK